MSTNPDRAETLAKEIFYGLPGVFNDAHMAHATGQIRLAMRAAEDRISRLEEEVKPLRERTGLSTYIDELKRERDEAKQLAADREERISVLVQKLDKIQVPLEPGKSIEDLVISKLRNRAGYWEGDQNARAVLRHHFSSPVAPATPSEGSR